MLRENLIGTLLEIGMPDGEQTLLIVDFLGEGAEGVVYAVASPDDPADQGQAVKIFKPAPFLEMDTLHHGFTVHVRRYPDHPLAIPPERRLAMLTTEMLAKIDDGHLVFRIELYRQILDATIAVLARSEYSSLDELPVVEWLDDNLLHRIEEVLDDDSVNEALRGPIESIRDELEQCIPRWQAAGTYLPVSRNPLVNLLGLHVEDFINEVELVHIGKTEEFTARVRSEHIEGLFQTIATCYFYIRGRMRSGRAVDSDRTHLERVVVACDLLRDFATRPEFASEPHAELAGIGRARLLTLLSTDQDLS